MAADVETVAVFPRRSYTDVHEETIYWLFLGLVGVQYSLDPLE